MVVVAVMTLVMQGDQKHRPNGQTEMAPLLALASGPRDQRLEEAMSCQVDRSPPRRRSRTGDD